MLLSQTTYNVALAQMSCHLTPEMQSEFSDATAMPMNYCFDIDWVQENCIPVYINVNVHFFLDDDCQGELAAAEYVDEDLSVHNAFTIAENLLNDANEFLEIMSQNNQGQWQHDINNAIETDPQCVPVRYVLNGTYIHCDSDAQSSNVSFNDFNDFEIDGSTTVNIYISSLTRSSGFANNFLNDGVVENFNPGLFNHELAHIFDVGHTFEGDDLCDDTWEQARWSFDADCDGVEDKGDNRCWSHQPIFNGEDACDTSIFCEKHPCCDWNQQNNNLMTYSQWAFNSMYSALTPCQITRMLTDISDNMCDFVEDVTSGCPPPKANIGQLPSLDITTGCPTCFYLNASFNESVYEMEILDQSGTPIIATGTVTSQAGRYCLYPRTNKEGKSLWPNGLQSHEEYVITLTVYNECGDSDISELAFTLPDPCELILSDDDTDDPIPTPIILAFESLSPNPTTDYIDIRFNTKKEGHLDIYGFHQNSNTPYGQLHSADYGMNSDNEHTIQINVAHWESGTNAIIMHYEG